MLSARAFEIVTLELRHLQLSIVEMVAISLDCPNYGLVGKLKAARGQHGGRVPLGPYHMMEDIESNTPSYEINETQVLVDCKHKG